LDKNLLETSFAVPPPEPQPGLANAHMSANHESSKSTRKAQISGKTGQNQNH